jgi:hypothetical protein
MPEPHVTKADSIWWPVGVKVGSGRRKQERCDFVY